MMRNWFWAVILCVLPISTQAFDFQSFKKSRKVVVHADRAELCFTDTQDCHPVLLGKTTPKGKFYLTIYATDKAGYGGDVIGFKQENDFLFALHRVWTLKPEEHRLERIASARVSDRIMTNGCINVENAVYDKLKQYFVLEVI
jgi:hypothetical protein